MKVKRLPFNPGPAAWKEILSGTKKFAQLDKDITVDWLIIGGGFAGLTAAKRLRELHPKDRIAIVDAQQIGDGPAGRNSGFMIDLPHNLASKDYAGAIVKDRFQTELNRKAINFASSLAAEYQMPPDAFEISGKVNAAATQKGNRHNLDYAGHLDAMGEGYELLDAAQMTAVCGSSYYQSGLYTPGTAMLQPALYVNEFAKGLHQQSVLIFENSPIVGLTKAKTDWIAKSLKGRITAPKVIIATNGHIESFGYFKKRLMHIYLYASMSAPLSSDEERTLGGQSKWAFTPADPMGTTVRKFPTALGSRIIVRNRFSWSPKLEVNEKKLHLISKRHDRSFKNRFPNLSAVKMDYRWGGLLCLSINNVAAFGEIDEGLYSACCQNGLGTANGTLHGILAAEQASGISSNHLDYLIKQPEPARLPPEPFSSIGANAYMRWAEMKAGNEL